MQAFYPLNTSNFTSTARQANKTSRSRWCFFCQAATQSSVSRHASRCADQRGNKSQDAGRLLSNERGQRFAPGGPQPPARCVKTFQMYLRREGLPVRANLNPIPPGRDSFICCSLKPVRNSQQGHQIHTEGMWFFFYSS